ncbi:uncharacterized protein LOC120263720 isoform X1 [Dioscorea cayenensis subsp. rotundata]|uniref:Uncharacterized protein LOC120263720 isoform X1 n=2 Tax=Dioscorea cayennensis subsp. rotundata TaxID=55577 RepID=A0AB40BK53_DIOCR|nr:uncharacterized protein LOC120263720 isoform X1 [Dioscorea cayenensis subsp. rotundata]
MALSIHWYTILCFALIAGAFVGALWVIWVYEFRRKNEDRETEYESLFLDAGDRDRDGDVIGVRSGELWLSCWTGVNPAWLLMLRIIFPLIMISIILWDMQTYDWTIMVYYTEWTFTLVIIYFVIGACISAHGCWIYSKYHHPDNEETNGFLNGNVEEHSSVTLTYRTKQNRNMTKLQKYLEQEDKDQRAGFWGYAMQVIYQTSAGAVVLTDVVFWGLLVPLLSEHFKVNLIMASMHSVNAIFLLIDTALNSMSFPWFRMAYFILWSCAYVSFQWILHACGFTWWPYPFLELDTPWAPLWYLCMALVHIPCYGFFVLVVKAKNSFLSKFFPNAYIRSD